MKSVYVFKRGVHLKKIKGKLINLGKPDFLCHELVSRPECEFSV